MYQDVLRTADLIMSKYCTQGQKKLISKSDLVVQIPPTFVDLFWRVARYVHVGPSDSVYQRALTHPFLRVVRQVEKELHEGPRRFIRPGDAFCFFMVCRHKMCSGFFIVFHLDLGFFFIIINI